VGEEIRRSDEKIGFACKWKTNWKVYMKTSGGMDGNKRRLLGELPF
jgi:hypothetical protein